MSLKRMVVILVGFYCLMGVMPLFFGGTDYIMNILIMILIWAVVASCWDVIMGFAGIFSFGQVAFYVVGAYASAILSVSLHVPPVYAILLAAVITGLFGVLVGLPCLKLAGPYVALVTFAVHMTLVPFLRGPMGRAIGSGGAQGILTVPPVSLFGMTFSSEHLVPFFYLTLFLTIICTIILVLVIKSYWGTAFLALKDSENFAASLGISAFKYKLMVFGLTSFITGLFGALYAHYVGMLSTRMLSMDVFTILMIMIVIGGIGKYPGVVVGAVITVTLNQFLAPMGMYRPLIMGAIVVVLVLFLRDGLVNPIIRLISSRQKAGRTGEYLS
ncbi:MAG: branched-chain amino acid ABC transporter permease [Deltaproteobacteria bacterium]|nr:branched-chain amino acid ABC transporter permease [Deltaproteobacteria bacterium]